MGEFVGALGGFLMIVLIIVLAYRFVNELGICNNSIYNKRIVGIAVAAVFLGLFQFVIGALIINFTYNPVSVFDIRGIWSIQPVGGTLDILGNYSMDYLTGQGAMPMYFLLVKLIGSLLFEKYAECGLYISFLSGVVTYVTWGLVITRGCEDDSDRMETGDKLFITLLCLPASVFLFLPSAFSMFMALFGIFLLVWNNGKGNKVVSLVLAVLCLMTHISGIAAICVWAAGMIIDMDGIKAVIRDVAVISAVQLIVVIVSMVQGWGCDIEYLLVYAVPVMLVLSSLRIKISYNIMSIVNVLLVLFSGFIIQGKLTGLL